jgi:hypothetical protein
MAHSLKGTDGIIDMSLNAGGSRETARVLYISPNTVLHELRKKEAALSLACL